ncbi:MAG TPA: hypothetical protein VGG39_26870 [Polyangiaceae bacterium]|jgi:hypothetical protein
MNTTTKETVGLNIEIPVEVHRRAKAAAALAQMTWDEAVAAALDAWTRNLIPPAAKGSKR